jgi:hypothetical protein
MRHVILHHHIFKNAGTTLDFALQRQFKTAFASFDLADENSIVSQEQLIHFLDSRPELKAVSSHQFHAQEFRKGNLYFYNLALVRRPLSRLLSIYHHYCRSGSGELADMARQGTFSQFTEYLVSRYPHFVDNPQVILFANHGFYTRPTDYDDFARACARLKSFSLCAPVERLDEGLVTVEYFIGRTYSSEGG